MFGLKAPCSTCPFRNPEGGRFQLREERLHEIFKAPAFQCHKTVYYGHDEDRHRLPARQPLQCAGLIALQYKEGRPNQITQVATRLIGYDPAQVDGSGVFDTFAECVHHHKRTA
jgi:hypothetical protein